MIFRNVGECLSTISNLDDVWDCKSTFQLLHKFLETNNIKSKILTEYYGNLFSTEDKVTNGKYIAIALRLKPLLLKDYSDEEQLLLALFRKSYRTQNAHYISNIPIADLISYIENNIDTAVKVKDFIFSCEEPYGNGYDYNRGDLWHNRSKDCLVKGVTGIVSMCYHFRKIRISIVERILLKYAYSINKEKINNLSNISKAINNEDILKFKDIPNKHR